MYQFLYFALTKFTVTLNVFMKMFDTKKVSLKKCQSCNFGHVPAFFNTGYVCALIEPIRADQL